MDLRHETSESLMFQRLPKSGSRVVAPKMSQRSPKGDSLVSECRLSSRAKCTSSAASRASTVPLTAGPQKMRRL